MLHRRNSSGISTLGRGINPRALDVNIVLDKAAVSHTANYHNPLLSARFFTVMVKISDIFSNFFKHVTRTKVLTSLIAKPFRGHDPDQLY
jgi:hypothetical protein